MKPYLTLGDKLGRFAAQLAPNRNDRIVITYGGKAVELPTDAITRAILTGFLGMPAARKSTASMSAPWPRPSACRSRK